MLLLVSLFLFIQTVQDWVSKKAANTLEEKIGTKVELGGLYLDFPNGVSVEELFLEDQEGDTLAYVGELNVSVDYFALFHGEVEVSEIALENTVANINVAEDSSFNFDYIIAAFAAENIDTTVQTTDIASSDMAFDIGNIHLKNVNFSYASIPDGMKTAFQIGELNVEVETFDLEKQIYLADQIEIFDSKGSFEIIKTVDVVEEEVSEPIEMIVGSRSLSVDNVGFDFKNRPSNQFFSTLVGQLEATSEPIDLSKQQIELNSISIDSSIASFSMKSNSSIQESGEGASEEGEEWRISLAELNVNLLDFTFDDIAYPTAEKGIDFSHLKTSVNQLAIADFYFNGVEDLGLNLKKLNVSEKSGFKISEGQLDFKINSNSLKADKLKLTTNHSSIATTTQLRFQSLESIADNIGELGINSSFSQSIIGLKDLNYLTPDILNEPSLKPYTNLKFTLNGEVQGKVDELNFQNLSVKTAKNTQLTLSGKLKNATNPDRLAFNFPVLKLSTTNQDLHFLLAENSIPTNISLPEKINISTKTRGTLNDLHAKLSLESSLGNLMSVVHFLQPRDTTQPAEYHLKAEIPSFNIGELLKDSLFGNLGFSGQIDGKGASLEEMDLDLDAIISDFDFQGYRYADLEIKGNLQEEAFDGELHMNDSNLIFDFGGTVKLDSVTPQYDFLLDLKGADLQHLGFVEKDLRINGQLEVDISGSNLENLNGGASIRDVFIIQEGKQYQVDSLLFLSIIDSGRTDISMRSNLLDASFKGNIYLSDLSETLENHFANYLNSKNRVDYTKSQDFNFEIIVKEPDLLTEVIMPDLKRLETGQIKGSFNSQTDELDLKIDFPRIDYADFVVDSLKLTAISDENQLDVDFFVQQLSLDTLGIKNIYLGSENKNDSAIITFVISEDSLKKQLQLIGSLTKVNNDLQFHFHENEQIINSNIWEVNPMNRITIGNSIWVDSLGLSRNKQKIAFQSVTNYLSSTFQNFKLESFSDLIESVEEGESEFELYLRQKRNGNNGDTLKEEQLPILQGVLNADLKFPTTNTLGIEGTAEIIDLTVQQMLLGKLSAGFWHENETDSLYLALVGEKNKIEAKGWRKGEHSEVDVDLSKLEVQTLAAFSGEEISQSEGYINGKANYNGTIKEHELSGTLNFISVKFRSKLIGETYHLPEESLVFENNQLKFKEFLVIDSSNQEFSIKGIIGLQDLENPKFDLKVKSEKFQFLNTSKKDKNDLFYGQLFVTSDIRVTGNLERPKVNAEVKLEKGTDVTFIVPDYEATTVNREGIVEFVDKDERIPELLREDKTADTANVDIFGIDFTSLFEIDDETKVTIVVDPITGDRLVVKGGGKIRADVDPAGNVYMNGVYEIKEGNYELRLYNLVRRKFELDQGSKLVWNGDPLEAEMDIRGLYTAKASPIGLLGSQISNLSEAERLQYRRTLPFLVILNLGGEIMKPEISFELNLPQDEKGGLGGAISAKLNELNQDQSELNKQVFSLIVLKRFFSQDPFGSGGGGATAARQSVSQLLNQQLNSLTDKYIKGVAVELNVDSYEDYSQEGELQGRTELNLALSKNLFNERVVVRVNGDFDVENADQNQSSAIAGDVSVLYKITDDGRYRLKIYRDNRYEGLIEGEFIETGVALIYIREYELFKNLFKNPEKVRLEEDE